MASFESIEDALFLVSIDIDGTLRLEEFNHTFAEIFDVERVNRRDTEAPSPDFADRLTRALRQCAQQGQPVRFDLATRIGAGVHRWQFLLNQVHGCDAPSQIVGHGHDVTVHRRSLADLKRITGKLLTAQDEERRRIARELHDSTAQQLVALGICISRLEVLLEKGTKSRAGYTPEKCLMAEMRNTLSEALNDIRTLTFLLHPPALENSGIADALRRFVSGFARRTGILANVAIEEGLSCRTSEVAKTIIRITQEALINVYRHAEATKVAVALSSTFGGFVLTIEDNGKGFCPNVMANVFDEVETLGVGIPGMRARVHQLNGELFIESSPRGVRIRAVIP